MRSSPRRTVLAVLAGVAALAVPLAACSSDAAPAASTTPGSTTPPPTTVNRTPIATMATTTTIAPVPITHAGGAAITIDELVLRGDGLGPVPFGTADDVVIAGLDVLLGAPVTDVRAAYAPIPPPTDAAGSTVPVSTVLAGPGDYVNAAGDEQYSHLAGRTTCWANGFCAQFGGDTPAQLTFTGWHLDGGNPKLSTSTGIVVGSLWSDVAKAVEGPLDACGGEAQFVAKVEGGEIRLTMASTGAPFNHVDPSGATVGDQPDPKLVVVTFMQAGDVAAFPTRGC